MSELTVYIMRPGELKNFVHNMAQVGDICIAYDDLIEQRYMYVCTKDNIGKNIDPVWEITF